MCVHGNSGGAGATAYTLTWYNGGSFLDRVLLENGSVFSDINRGCEVPNGQFTYVCNGNQGNGCSNWPTQLLDPPGYFLEYISQDASPVDQWTGNAALNPTAPCGGANPTSYSS
ncbi:MAG TPA: hypothetical protein VND65_11710 [Candidatus Binatia bacterium]|nr:hypothetical protein [Candidatus Binatia bacterium]